MCAHASLCARVCNCMLILAIITCHIVLSTDVNLLSSYYCLSCDEVVRTIYVFRI